MNWIIEKWHAKLDMPKNKLDWHRQDVADELQELQEAIGVINRWSELSDVAYTYTRAHWSGHQEISLPIKYPHYLIGLIYMFPKYQLRWNFFAKVGKKVDEKAEVKEVRNPQKMHKLKHIAQKYNLDEDKFVDEAKKLMRKRVFLK